VFVFVFGLSVPACVCLCVRAIDTQHEQKDLGTAQSVIAKEKARTATLSSERTPSQDRTTNLKHFSQLERLEDELKEKLKHYEDRDPTVLRALGEKGICSVQTWNMHVAD